MLSAFGYGKFGLIAAVCVFSWLAENSGLLLRWNQSLGDVRMALSSRVSSGRIVFVAVDARSLNEIGTWPWSRSVHATILDRLVEGGALDVLFDFDLTFPSDPEGDRAFQGALERAGGATYLAVFGQAANADDPGSRHFNLPLPRFAERSWPALVNVGADADGLVRHYPYGAATPEGFVSSAGALIANRLTTDSRWFEIDFSVRPATIPVISASALLRGTAPLDLVAGRTVIVGASALELSDRFAVPVHGVVAGPLIHALAAETLIDGSEPRWLRGEWVALSLVAFLALIGAGLRRSAILGLACAAAGLFAVELASLALFRAESLQVPSAMLYPAVLGFILSRISQALLSSDRSLFKAGVEARNSLRLLERVFHDSSDGIVILSQDGSIMLHSASAMEFFGAEADGSLRLPRSLVRRHPSPVIPGASSASPPNSIEIGHGMSRRTLEYQSTSSEVELPTGRGREMIRSDITTLIFRDVTRLNEQEREIAYLSNHDERTGALRRSAFLAFLGLRLESGCRTVVFVLSLDRFKTINVTLGRDIGDALLREVVSRLGTSGLQLSAAVRLGGTTFAVYTEGDVENVDADCIARRLLDEISLPYRLEDANAQIGVRLGFTIVDAGQEIPAAVALEQAEDAMDTAKQEGRAFAFYDQSAWERQRRARDIERAMEAALQDGEFVVRYQPQHRVSDGALIGAEALLRWQSPKFGDVRPEDFVSIAESTGFIVTLGKWVLERAALDAQQLPADVKIAVNVSGLQIMRSDFATDVHDVLRKVGLPANRICLELTETVLVASTNGIVETMQDLSFSGFTWALDDFGTGYSSMAYLSKMPLEKIKLDKSFTMALEDDPTARPILHSTSELCRGLGVKLLCEGVETDEQLRILAAEGCHEAQGYLFGRPMALQRLAELRRKGHPGIW